MAKPENSKPNIPHYVRSSAKVHPSNDFDADPNSYSLEKFKLYETRQVPNQSVPNSRVSNSSFFWDYLIVHCISGFTWLGAIGTRGSSGCWRSTDRSPTIWTSAKTPSSTRHRRSRACFRESQRATVPPEALPLWPRFLGSPVSVLETSFSCLYEFKFTSLLTLRRPLCYVFIWAFGVF